MSEDIAVLNEAHRDNFTLLYCKYYTHTLKVSELLLLVIYSILNLSFL